MALSWGSHASHALYHAIHPGGFTQKRYERHAQPHSSNIGPAVLLLISQIHYLLYYDAKFDEIFIPPV